MFLAHVAGLLSYISRVFRDTLGSRIFFSGGEFSLFGRNAYLVYVEVSLDENNNDGLCRSRDTRV